MANYPTQHLQPGMTGPAVKQLQDYLVNQGYMTQSQVNTGYGIYGPQTTAAVKSLQQSLGVDNSTGPGFFGPRTISALQTKQTPSSVSPSDSTTGNPQLDGILGQLSGYLDKLSASGQVVNPNIELNPSQISGFLDQATKEISPYYSSQINSIKDDLSKNIQNLQQQWDINKQSSEAQFKQNLANQRENQAGSGISQSGVRGQQENALASAQQRTLDLGALQTQNSIGNSLRSAEGQIGSSNLPGLPQFNSSTVSTQGEGGYIPGRTLDFGNTGGISGSIPGSQQTAIAQRQNQLETAARQSRVLDFYNT